MASTTRPGERRKKPRLISQPRMVRAVRLRGKRLFALAQAFATTAGVRRPLRLTSPLLGALQAESSQLEELLDSFGAKNNTRWFLFREMIATIKNFSQIGDKLLHIQHALGRYVLLPVEGDLRGDTRKALGFVAKILQCVLGRLMRQAMHLGLGEPTVCLLPADFEERLPPGALRRDRKTRHSASASERIVHVATAFLDLAEDSAELQAAVHAYDAKGAPTLMAEAVTEAGLRTLEYGFHNLQSLYDTYISDSDTEELDGDLRMLRSHVSLILHLLETGTILVHFTERHLALSHSADFFHAECPLDLKQLRHLVMNHCLRYATRTINATRDMCHGMLRRYATVSTICVPVPRYRGFHVRPATLVAKIVAHYGSEITMRLGEETYDAGSALELFRANEQINAEKRRLMAAEIARMAPRELPDPGADLAPHVKHTLITLAEANRILIYEQPVPVGTVRAMAGMPPEAAVLAECTRLFSAGKIDLPTDVSVSFTGDDRVLHDIAALAANGYCEDSFGNNTPLPRELNYLRRHR